MNRLVALRLEKTRRIIEARMWAARAVVIRRQLVEMRQVAP